jgi:hypothetical protein
MQNSGLSGLSGLEIRDVAIAARQAEADLEWPGAARIPIVALTDF